MTTMTMRTEAAATAVAVALTAARGADDVMTFSGRVMAMGVVRPGTTKQKHDNAGKLLGPLGAQQTFNSTNAQTTGDPPRVADNPPTIPPTAHQGPRPPPSLLSAYAGCYIYMNVIL